MTASQETLRTLYYPVMICIMIRDWKIIAKVQASPSNFGIDKVLSAQVTILFISCLQKTKYKDNLTLTWNLFNFVEPCGLM